MGNKLVEWLSALATKSEEVAKDILMMNFTVVNACLVGSPDGFSKEWVLVDTGLENSADYIVECASKRFGEDSKPQAIILTHGHFDHVGSVIKLSELWDVPVYIHELELPYITGKEDYPLADSTVDEGMVAKLSTTFPHTSIDLGMRAIALPENGEVPGLPGWKWIPTPGHTKGHISLFRKKDRVLIAGDAFSTTKQETILSVLLHNERISGPPKYLTTDWQAAEESVTTLMKLKPELAITSHGEPMSGVELSKHLEYLVTHFDTIAKPEQGRFLER